jgi:hypothetical protein
MGIPTSEVGYSSATTRRGDYEVHDGHVVELENNNNIHSGINLVAFEQLVRFVVQVF